MSVIANENYVAFYKPEDPRHRRWLLAVLDHLTAREPHALSEGALRDLWLAPETAPPGVTPAIKLALPLIREFEGCPLRAYPDPAHGANVWTIGWGTTVYSNGTPVRQGDVITQERADQELLAFVVALEKIQAQRVPGWSELKPTQQAALLSFAYNLGPNWYGSSGFDTLTRTITNKRWADIPAAFELYRNPGTNVEAGLLRRRRAEARMFLDGLQIAPPPPPPVRGELRNPLPVYPYLQLDSATDQGRRMCFSSSCAMLVEFLRPGTLKGVNGDDQYLRRLQELGGDTISVQAQLRAMRSYGVEAQLVQNADFALIERQTDAGIPVPAAYIHRGPIARPTGFGHWLTIIGYDATGAFVHDPLGEPDLITGATLSTRGANLRFSKENFGRRWMVRQVSGGYTYAPGHGWAIIAKP